MSGKLSKWLLGRRRNNGGELLAALDVGSDKVVCLIARLDDESEQLRVVGIGHNLSQGMRNGLVSDIAASCGSITVAVEAAEEMAGEQIESVTVGVSGALLLSQTVGVDIALGGREIIPSDMERLKESGQDNLAGDQNGNAPELIHAMAVEYALDGKRGIREPTGMIGNTLHARMHMVSAGFGPVRTLAAVIARCRLGVEQMVAAPYASGLACLVEDEMNLGSVVIDMGAGTTSIGVFYDGHLVFADGVPMGGYHVTSDIARGLTTTFAHAERLKTLHGEAVPAYSDAQEMIAVPQVGEEAPQCDMQVPKSRLAEIIQPRIEEILEAVRSRLDHSGFGDISGRRVVLTGGSSQLTGIRDLAQKVLEKQVRLGRTLRISSPYSGTPLQLSGDLAKPTFVTAAGLLVAASRADLAATPIGYTDHSGGTMWERAGNWLRQG